MSAALRRLSVVRIARARPRLMLGFAVAVALIVFLPWDWKTATRLLLAWDLGVLTYLIAALRVMGRSDVHRIRRRAALQDEGQTIMLVLTVAAAVASLGAIGAELATVKSLPREWQTLHVVLAFATIALSWTFIHLIFALHYAHEFYDEQEHRGGGLTFPGTEPPDYWDFVYFSFVIGMTSQVSDVAITSKAIRRTATAHGILSFVFNVAILALSVGTAGTVLLS